MAYSIVNDYGGYQPRQPQQSDMMNAIQSAAIQAMQMRQQMNDPRTIASVAFPNMPRDVLNSNDPNRIIDYLNQNSSSLNPLQQAAMGMLFHR